jgi:hypothetical protein
VYSPLESHRAVADYEKAHFRMFHRTSALLSDARQGVSGADSDLAQP